MFKQTELVQPEVITLDRLWLRAALKECVAYGEHGTVTETVNGRATCWNCGNHL